MNEKWGKQEEKWGRQRCTLIALSHLCSLSFYNCSPSFPFTIESLEQAILMHSSSKAFEYNSWKGHSHLKLVDWARKSKSSRDEAWKQKWEHYLLIYLIKCWWLKQMAFHPKHFKWDQNTLFKPLSKKTCIPNLFVYVTPSVIIIIIIIITIIGQTNLCCAWSKVVKRDLFNLPC